MMHITLILVCFLLILFYGMKINAGCTQLKNPQDEAPLETASRFVVLLERVEDALRRHVVVGVVVRLDGKMVGCWPKLFC